MGDYSWSQRTIKRGDLTIGEVADELRVSVWTVRRLLKRSGLPARLHVRFWHDSHGRLYSRRCWSIPRETCEVLFTWRLFRLAEVGQRFSQRIQGSLRAEARRRGDQAGLEWLRGLSVSRPQLPDLRMPLT